MVQMIKSIKIITALVGFAPGAVAKTPANAFNDPRIAGVPRDNDDGPGGYSDEDLVMIWKVVRKALDSGSCPKIVTADVNPHDASRYYVTCEPASGPVFNVEYGKDELLP